MLDRLRLAGDYSSEISFSVMQTMRFVMSDSQIWVSCPQIYRLSPRIQVFSQNWRNREIRDFLFIYQNPVNLRFMYVCIQLISPSIYPPNHENIDTMTRPQHRELRPLGSLTPHRVITNKGCETGPTVLGSLSEKTRKSNHLQRSSVQRQHFLSFLLSYLKTLSVGPAGV